MKIKNGLRRTFRAISPRRRARTQLNNYLIREKNLFSRVPELKTRFGSPESEEFHEFIETEAIFFYREIQEAAIPFPSSSEMVNISGETDLRSFVYVGYDCYRLIRTNLPDNFPLPGRILDFGVGCGRTMRFFYRDMDQFNSFGCDVDQNAIRYLKKNVPFIQARVNKNLPPLPYSMGYFQLVYSISVFTHLNLPAFQTWLVEIHRILDSRGIFQLTLHGDIAIRSVHTDKDLRTRIGLSEGILSNQENRLNNGFLWMQQPVGSKDIDSSQFGITFIQKDFFEELIQPFFTIVNYQEGAVSGWQDFVTLRKKI